MKHHSVFSNPFFSRTISTGVIGWILGVLVYYFMSYSEAVESAYIWINYLLASICGIIVAFLVYANTLRLNDLLSWQLNTGSRLLTGVLLNCLTAFVTVFSLSFFYIKIVNPDQVVFPDYTATFIKLGILIFILIIIYSVIYFALYAYYQYARVQIETVRLERKQMDLQFNTLKAQLSPHFLFNGLNTISSLMYRDLPTAELFIRQLARTYQYTLASYNNKLVTIKEELEFVDAFQYLLQIRFGKKLIILTDIPYTLMDTKIPPLTLQLLVENAAKHNEMTMVQPLKIEINTGKDWIWVINNKTQASNEIPSLKIGLTNVKERYRILANKEIEIINAEKFIVKLPIIP